LKKINLFYEEFLNNPEQNIRKIVNFLSLDISKEKFNSLTEFIVSKEKIRKISKKVLIMNYLKKGLTRPWKVIPFIYKRFKANR
jgi:hypothetical protein